MRCLLLLFCIALIAGSATAQEVKPVINEEYRTLLRQQPAALIPADTSNSFSRSLLQYRGTRIAGSFTPGQIQKKGNQLHIRPYKRYTLHIAGIYSAATEWLQVNRTPDLQTEYAQGRSASGQLQWRGPDTQELFSYGPSLSQLEFDGSAYAWDPNGRLVNKGSGNGKPAASYNNSIFRSGFLWNNSLQLNTRLLRNSYTPLLAGNLQVSTSNEKNIVRGNHIQHLRLTGAMDVYINKWIAKGAYSLREEGSRFNNRIGFINRLYRYSLLTPASFRNDAGAYLSASTPRAYSNEADNPVFLTHEINNNQHKQRQHIFTTGIRKEKGNLSVNFSQQLELLHSRQADAYAPGAADWPGGYYSLRNQQDRNLRLQFTGTWNVQTGNNDDIRGPLQLNYIYADNLTRIDYSAANQYRFQRSSNDFAISFAPVKYSYEKSTGFTLIAKLYQSNTSTRSYFLPSAGGFIRRSEFLGIRHLDLRIKSQYSVSRSEIPVSRSYAGIQLIQQQTGTIDGFAPVSEVIFTHLVHPILLQEWQAATELLYRNKIGLSAQWFNRSYSGDIYPVFQSGLWQFENLADHRNRGAELELNLYPNLLQSRHFTMSHLISFTSYRSKVTGVKPGFENNPMAGFSGVNKVFVKGRPAGLIAGTDFLRNADGQLIIGSDGFPLVNPVPVIIGDPNPDFILKITHALNWKQWGFSADWEWRKGGDIWNGTRALLDYYGRSSASAAERIITQYVYAGVQTSGAHNTTPVDFYNPSIPLSQHHRVRYGEAGVASAYIEKGDFLRINYAGVSRKFKIKKSNQRMLTLALYARNLFVRSAYKGADPNQLLYDTPGTSGLDFFNLPSARCFGFSASVQF